MMHPRRRHSRFGLATLVTTLLLAAAWAPLTQAGSRSDPEVSDAAGDVSPGAFAANNPGNSSFFQNVTIYDVVRAWIGLETQDAFWLFIEVSDLPDGWGLPAEPPPQSPFGHNLSFAGTSLVAHFNISGVGYQAVARLAMPNAGEIVDNYTLWRGQEWAAVSGVYNTTQDWVAMLLPKAAFGGIPDGVLLTKFWVQGRYLDRAMDYAPNARDLDTGSLDPLKLAEKIAQGQVVAPRFGANYAFGQYYRPSAGGGGGGNPPGLTLQLQSDAQQRIRAGEVACYEVLVTNTGAIHDAVLLALSSAHEGWSHQMSESQFPLAPGEMKRVFLTVSAAEGAASPMRSLVHADTMRGASQSLSVLTFLDPTAPGPTNGPGGSPGPTDEFSPTPDSEGNGTPGLGAVAILVALATLAVLARRRR